MSTLVAGAALGLPLPAAAGVGEGDRDAPSAPAPARAAIERSEEVPFTGVDVALLLGGTAAVIGLGLSSRRFVRERT